jgi:hypothetical protein
MYKATTLIYVIEAVVMAVLWFWAYHKRRDFRPFLFLGIVAAAGLFLSYFSILAVFSPDWYLSVSVNHPRLGSSISIAHCIMSVLNAGGVVWLVLHILNAEQRHSSTAPSPRTPRSRLAWASLLFGILAPLSIGLIPLAPHMVESLILVPIAVSLAAVLLALAALLRIAFSRGRRKGVGLALISLALGLCTGVPYTYVLAKGLEQAFRNIG